MFANTVNCVISLLLIIGSSAADDDPTLVTLPYGQIKGHVLKTRNGNLYNAFQEVPYAAPPINKLRFKEAVPPSKWYGILETTRNTKVCYQIDSPIPSLTLKQTEDCLYLNVFVPSNATDALPVLVWLHGGGYVYGDGPTYGPQFFIDYSIAVVTLNYRLGPLGFLTTEDGVIPGNLGLKDQNLALRWVKDNIALFGGDPEKVTLAGESAGASSVGLHLVSPRSEGLFRAAILQSGTALAPFTHQPFARYLAFETGRSLDSNFTSEDSSELLALLQSLPASEITNVNVITPWEAGSAFPLWTPVIEHEKYAAAFITGPMHEDIKNGNIRQVPIIIGFNSEEQLTFIADGVFSIAGGLSSLKKDGALYDSDLSAMVDNFFNIAEEDKYTAGEQLRQIYTDGTFGDDVGALIRYSSDFTFTTPAIRHAELQSNYTDVYLYQFSYNGELGQLLLGGEPVDIEGIDPNGVGHAEDVLYLWEVIFNGNMNNFPSRDRLVQSFLLSLWTNFVKYLNPTPRQEPSLQNVIWPKVSPNNLIYLNINSTLSIETDPKEYKKWKEIIDKYAIPPLIIY